MKRRPLASLAALLLAPGLALACAPDALGTSRTLTLPRRAAAYGTVQHAALPLRPGEVVLSFDDGPRRESTPLVLQALRAACVQASFFMVGEALRAEPGLAREVEAAGHGVALHSHGHPHLAALSATEQLEDLEQAEAAFLAAFGHRAPAYRFPFLEEAAPTLDALKARGMTVMSIDAGIDDWLPDQSPEMLSTRMVERLKASGGGILLLHDAQDQTARALPLLLQTLKAQGLHIVHLRWESP